MKLPAPLFILVIIGAILAFVVANAFQLRNDKRLSEKSFIQLIGLSFNQFVFFKKTPDSKDDTDKSGHN
jgi:hypothetical protein